MRIRITLACLVAAVALTACANSEKKAAGPAATTKMVSVNTMCPIAGDDFGKAPGSTRTVKGTTVGFCCDHCSAKFDKMTDAEKENIINLAKANRVLGH